MCLVLIKSCDHSPKLYAILFFFEKILRQLWDVTWVTITAALFFSQLHFVRGYMARRKEILTFF